jgi:hypothetical protein
VTIAELKALIIEQGNVICSLQKVHEETLDQIPKMVRLQCQQLMGEQMEGGRTNTVAAGNDTAVMHITGVDTVGAAGTDTGVLHITGGDTVGAAGTDTGVLGITGRDTVGAAGTDTDVLHITGGDTVGEARGGRTAGDSATTAGANANERQQEQHAASRKRERKAAHPLHRESPRIAPPVKQARYSSGSQMVPLVTPASSPAARPSLAMWPCLHLKPTIEEEEEEEEEEEPQPQTDEELEATTEIYAEEPNRHTKDPDRHAKDQNRHAKEPNRHAEDPNRHAADPNRHAEQPNRHTEDANRHAEGLQSLGKQLSDDCPGGIAPLTLTAPLGRPITAAASTGGGADDEDGNDCGREAEAVWKVLGDWLLQPGVPTRSLEKPQGDMQPVLPREGGSVGWRVRCEQRNHDDDAVCEVCHQTTPWGTMILCEHCDLGYHINCVDPPLASVLQAGWVCPTCRPGWSGAAERREPVLSGAERFTFKKARGSSRFKGVSWRKTCRKWCAYIHVPGLPTKHVGLFDNEEDAARAHDTAAVQHELTTRLNFPLERDDGECEADSTEAVHPVATDLMVVADPPSVSVQPKK